MNYKRTIRTNEEQEMISAIKPSRYNYILSAVNVGDSPDSIEPALNAGERKLFEDLTNELAEYRKTDPKAAFWPRELDYEEIPDLYPEGTWDDFRSDKIINK